MSTAPLHPRLDGLAPLTESIAELPAASICGGALLPRVRAGLLELGGEMSIAGVHLFVAELAVDEPRPSDTPLAEVARTDRARQSLVDGYFEFRAAAEASGRSGRAVSARLAWIVPDRCLTWTGRVAPELARQIERDAELQAFLGWEYQEWLPWISVGLVGALRKWRSPRLNAVRRAIFKAARKARGGDGFAGQYPWKRSFPPHLRRWPLQVLYQYEPTNLVHRAITEFLALGLHSLDDLRCCHPDAARAAKNSTRLLAVRRLFEELV